MVVSKGEHAAHIHAKQAATLRLYTYQRRMKHHADIVCYGIKNKEFSIVKIHGSKSGLQPEAESAVWLFTRMDEGVFVA